MKKIIFLLLITCNLSFSFVNEIRWKKETISPFNKIKIYTKDGEYRYVDVKKGSYKIILFSLDYPDDLISKNKFYKQLQQFLDRVKPSVKYNLILNKQFFQDIERISSFELIDDEEIIEKPASSLTFLEKSVLNELTSEIRFSYYNNTDQEYLNRQIYLLYKILEKDNYNANNIYSEFEKEELISELINGRKKIVDKLENSKLELFVRENFDNIHTEPPQISNSYFFDNDIIISDDIKDQAILPNIKENVYLTNIDDTTLLDLVQNKIKLKRKILIVENNQFTGYNFNNENVVIFVNNGNDNVKQKIFVYYDGDYKINVVVEKTNFEQLINENSNYYISDFFGK